MSVKILHIIWDGQIGGAERAVFQLVRAQRTAGLLADVLICNRLGHYGTKIRECGAEVHLLGMQKAWDVTITREFRAMLRKYTIVHFHSCEPYLMLAAAGLGDVRLFYTHRGGVFNYRLIKALRYKFCGHILRHHFSGISGNTMEGARAASQLFNIPLTDVKVTYNGLDFTLLQPAVNKAEILNSLNLSGRSKIVVGTTAIFKSWKRIDYLIASISEIKRDDVACVIVGDGPERQSLEALTGELHLAEKVIFVGKQSNTADYLQVMDVFVLPSASLESFGNSAVEAMAFGIPTIVMHDGGGLVEHIVDGDNGYIASSRCDLVEKLAALVGDPALRHSIGAAAKNHVTTKYSLAQMVTAYNKLYQLS